MVEKISLENLYIVKETATGEDIMDIFEMRIAVPWVVVLVTDENNVLKGVIGGSDIQAKNIAGGVTAADIMNKNYLYLHDSEDTNMGHMAEVLMNGRNFHLLPVVDSKGVLLYAFLELAGPVAAYKRISKPRFSFEAILGIASLKRKEFPDCRIRIASDLGKAAMSIELEDIKKCDERDLIVLGYDNDYDAMRAVDECRKYSVRYFANVPQDLHGRLTDYFRVDKEAKETLDYLAEGNGWYFEWLDAETIFQVIRQTVDVAGDYVEIGTYRGDSARAALEFMDRIDVKRKCYFLDTYEGFCYEVAHNSVDSLWYDTHRDTSIEFVRKRISRYKNAVCIKNNIIEDAWPEQIKQIAVCNIDVDLYEAYVYALEKVREKIVRGGVILTEDFGHTPALIGGQKAILEFVEKYKGEFFVIYGRGSQLLLYKK